MKTKAKNEVHAALMRRLIVKPSFSDPFGLQGRRLAELELPAAERETIDGCMRQLDFCEAEIAEIERVIAAEALGSDEIRRLMTVPGVNVICAATFLAAIGDIRRFESARRLVGYLGLDPRVGQSGSGPAKARLPVLVPAHPRAGLRLCAALVDEEEAASARARRQRPAGQAEAGHLGREQGDAHRRARTGPTGRGGL